MDDEPAEELRRRTVLDEPVDRDTGLCRAGLNRVDEKGRVIGSTYFIGNERLCWRCQHERGYGEELD